MFTTVVVLENFVKSLPFR